MKSLACKKAQGEMFTSWQMNIYVQVVKSKVGPIFKQNGTCGWVGIKPCPFSCLTWYLEEMKL